MILILNDSPRLQGNTSRMADAFAEGACDAGAQVKVVNVARRKIAGCLACERCHASGNSGECVQKDGMQEVYDLVRRANALVIASPIYSFGFSGQLQCAANRLYALGGPENLPNLKASALLLSAGDEGSAAGAVFAYRGFASYMKLECAGEFISSGSDDNHTTPELLEEVRQAGKRCALGIEELQTAS